MGGPRMAGRRIPYKESYGGEPNWNETPGETTPEMVLYGEERPAQKKNTTSSSATDIDR